MKFDSHSPLIGIPVCARELDGHPFHMVGEKYITGVGLGAGGLPMLIPALGDAFDPRDLVRRLDGLLVTGSPSNVAVEPLRRGARPARQPAGSQARRHDPAADPRRGRGRPAALLHLPRHPGAERRLRRHAAYPRP